MTRSIDLMASFMLVTLLVGCGQQNGSAPASRNADNEVHASAHHHDNSPHGGTLTDWGGGAYHVEFTVDHAKKEAAVYILGGDVKTPAPIEAAKIHLFITDPATDMELVAMPLEGEADGKSSRFVGTHDTIGIVREFTGTISGEIDGTPYTGDFREESH